MKVPNSYFFLNIFKNRLKWIKNPNLHDSQIKEQVNNIKDKLNTKFDDMNIKVKHDIDIKHDINIKLNDKLEMSTRERKTFKTKI